MKKVKEILKKALNYVYYTKIGKLIASLLLAFTSFGLANYLDLMFYVGLVFMIYPIGLFLVMMAYAWVINPIRDWKESQKNKKNQMIGSLNTVVVPTIKAEEPIMTNTAMATEKIIEIEEKKIKATKEKNKTTQKQKSVAKKSPITKKKNNKNK